MSEYPREETWIIANPDFGLKDMRGDYELALQFRMRDELTSSTFTTTDFEEMNKIFKDAKAYCLKDLHGKPCKVKIHGPGASIYEFLRTWNP